MSRVTGIIALCSALVGCAHADYAQLADSATTAVGLSQGYVEGNPVLSGLDWPYIAVIKLSVTQAVKLTPPVVCEPGLLGLTVGGYSLALWNIGVMAGSGPAAVPVALGLAIWQWDNWAADAQSQCPLGAGIVGSSVAHEVTDDEYDLLVYRE